MRANGMSYSAAFAYVQRKRACVKPNSGFVRALQDWEGTLAVGGSGSAARPGMGRRFTT
jgi:hypothetical protein